MGYATCAYLSILAEDFGFPSEEVRIPAFATRSEQGDANNNLFAIVASIAKRMPDQAWSLYRIYGYESPCASKSWRKPASASIIPFRISIDPWLGASLRQPELYAIARNPGMEPSIYSVER